MHTDACMYNYNYTHTRKSKRMHIHACMCNNYAPTQTCMHVHTLNTHKHPYMYNYNLSVLCRHLHPRHPHWQRPYHARSVMYNINVSLENNVVIHNRFRQPQATAPHSLQQLRKALRTSQPPPKYTPMLFMICKTIFHTNLADMLLQSHKNNLRITRINSDSHLIVSISVTVRISV